MRTTTENLGLLEKRPPDAIVDRHVQPRLRLRGEQRAVLVELAHWSYGAAGGAAYGLLPRRLRDQPWIGVAYGLAVWLAFETAIAPLLNLRHAEERQVAARTMIALDHVLYGVVVSGQLAPEPERP